MTFKGSSNYEHKRRTFHMERSGNRKFWKRYARRALRRGKVNAMRDGWLKFLINNP
jgi:hypothetical protein